VIHRDVKPENILLTDAGIPRLSDFGIAKLGDRDRKVIPSLTRPGMILGSVNYLSPEACYGKALDARADIWALGIVLFEMLAGRPPFTGPTIAATLTAILGQPLPEISGQRRGVPDSVAALLQEMLEKDRDRRIGSARLVAAKLEQILGGHAAADPSTVSMPDTLLQTKLGIPPSRPNLVPRPHLLEALDRAREAKLTLISAPAGFGKTTILTAWARQCDSPIAWLSLSADENDPSRFFLYMVNALKQVFTGIGGASAAMLQSMPPLPVRGALAILINEMSGTEEHGFLLLDDFHLLEDPQISEGLAHLIENMPEWMHIIVSTRSDPPLQLSRLRARGQMLELRQSDLRFSEAEAAVFLNQTIGLRLSEQQIRKLEARTEGWIAGLQLAALSMREKPDLVQWKPSLRHRLPGR
jgi:hypothetical protein